MNRFNEPDDSRKKGQDRDVRPNWYDTLGREPGQMSKEPTLAQMRKIKEESTMTKTYAPTRNKGKMAIGAIVAAGVIFGGVWGAHSAGWLDDGMPNAAQTQVAGQAQNGPGSGGNQAGGAVGGGQTEGQNTQISAEAAAEAEARKAAETFKREDLTVTQAQLDVFKSEFQSGDEDGEGMLAWIGRRHAELSPYAESEFLTIYFNNQAGNMPYHVAISTDSELAVENIEMKTRSVDLEKEQAVFDYTLDIVFSGGHDPLPMKGSIRMQKGENGWKVLKDTPQKASYLEFYKIAWPEMAGDE